MNLKVLLIDDHRLFREGLQSLLQRRNIEVLAAVGDGSEGMKLARELRPDIILLDMRMPIIDGISVLKQLKQRELSMPIVILTTSSNEQDLLDALKYGASGYLLKDMDPDALVIALRDINSGKTVVAPHLTSVLVRFVQGDTNTAENNIWSKDAATGSATYQTATANATMQANAVTNANTGGGQPVNNMQPYLVINFSIALTGVYPSRN